MPWTAWSKTTHVWQQLSTLTSSTDSGIDFVLRVREQFPLIVEDVSPCYIYNRIETP